MRRTFASKSLIWLVLVFGGIGVALCQPADYPKMTNEGFDDMAGTYFLFNTQSLLAESYSAKFPFLAIEFNRAQNAFNTKFLDSITNIDTILTVENRRWKSTKNEKLDEITSIVALASKRATQEDARKLAIEISNKAAGIIPSPYLETLLIYKTDFIRIPADELLSGFKRSLKTGNSSPVNLELFYPASWRASEGRRNTTLGSITSENGRGLENILVAVKELAYPESKQFTPAERAKLLSKESLRKYLGSGAVLLTDVPIKLDGLHGSSISFESEQLQLDIRVKMRSMPYVVLFRNKLIFIHCLVGSSPGEESKLSARFAKFEPVFRLIANSLTVMR
jgi:hypothetical protein